MGCVRRKRASAAAAIVIALTIPATADGALKPITGKLSKRGFTVLAVDADGRASTVTPKHGKFRLRPPSRRVTLHLRDANGVYAGPIVLAREERGRRAIVGVKPGTRLGLIRVDSRRDYSYSVRKPPRRSTDLAGWVRAKRGVPIGAGNFGRVRSRAARGPSHDVDRDGVVEFLDIDDDGDLVLDSLERRGVAARSARAAVIDDQFLMHTNLSLSVAGTVNANASGLTKQQVDAALSAQGRLQMGIIPGESPELDCGRPQLRTDVRLGGLSYCSRGGTGRFFGPGLPTDQMRFPDDFDLDGDGFGAMTPSNPGPAPGSGQQATFVRHGATTDQIGSGDLLIQHVVQSGVQREYPATLQFVFATVPAMVSYSDGQGNAQTVTYPPADSTAGTPLNPYPATAGGSSEVIVEFAYWRPQREAIDNERGPWIDIGGLNYMVGAGFGGAFCPQASFLDAVPADPKLRPLEPADVFPANYFGVKDTAIDKTSDPRNVMRFRLNLSSCATATGIPFGVGDTITLSVGALVPNGVDSALQAVAFKRT